MRAFAYKKPNVVLAGTSNAQPLPRLCRLVISVDDPVATGRVRSLSSSGVSFSSYLGSSPGQLGDVRWTQKVTVEPVQFPHLNGLEG